MTKLKKNLIFQTLYKIVISVAPLLTTPYLSRILGPDNLGIFSYRQSIVNFFILFAMLGTSTYGIRAIAFLKDEDKDLSKTFFEIYALQVIASLVTIVSYCIYLLLTRDEYSIISWIFLMYLVGALLDTTWFFFGIEEIKITSLRGMLIKLLSLLSVFLFVKTENDLHIYAIIVAGGTALGQIIMIPSLLKRVRFVRITRNGILKHLKPNLILFVPIAAVTLYHIMDKIMLGWFSTNYESGCYYNSDKVINVPIVIITGVHSVFLPRVSNSLATDEELERTLKTQKESMFLTMFLSFSMAFGIAAISKEFVPLFFGDGYEPCINLIKLFSIVMIIKSLSSAVRNLYVIPTKNDKIYLISVFCGAGVNLLFNIILIFFLNLGAVGATLGTLAAELVVLLIEVILFCKKEPKFNLLRHLFKDWFFAVDGLIMFAAVIVFKMLFQETIDIYVLVILEILIGVSVYVSLALIYSKITKKNIFNLFKAIKK